MSNKKAKLHDLLGRKPTDEEVNLAKKIDQEMSAIRKDAEEFVKAEIEKNYLTGSLKQLGELVRNALNKEIFKTNAYYEIIKDRKELDERPLNELSKVENVAETVALQNQGYQV